MLLVALGATLAVAPSARAAAVPTIVLDRAEARTGDRVVVTLSGWTGAVTLSVCGNLAKRGSADCNQVASQGVGLALHGPTTLAELVLSAPPTTCPCVVRAANATHDQVAAAPIVLTDVPTGPLVDPALAGPPLVVSVTARAVPAGLLGAIRSALGGPTPYDVAVVVRNRGSVTLPRVSLAGSAGRSRSEGDSFTIPAPGPLVPGQAKRRVIRTILPAPVLGGFVWEVTASGAGPSVHAEDTAQVVPGGLLALTSVLAVDVAAIVWRRRRSRSSSPGKTSGVSSQKPKQAAGVSHPPRMADQARSRSAAAVSSTLRCMA